MSDVPYVYGSDTSREAALSMEKAAVTCESRVEEYVKSRGLHGATADEVVHALGYTHQNGSARVSTLKKKGILVPTHRRRLTRSNRKAVVLIHRDVERYYHD